MKTRLIALAFGMLLPYVAVADTGLVTIPSKYSVAETMDRFEAGVRKAPVATQIFARIDLQALAASQGGKVRPAQLLIFGRGGVLQVLLLQTPEAAIDLPPKALAWEDENGKVWLTYNTGEYLAQRHGIKGEDDLMKRLTDFAAAFAKNAVE